MINNLFLFGVLFFLMSTHSFAKNELMVDPDILGIKIGMDKNEVITILKKNYPKLKFTKKTQLLELKVPAMVSGYDFQYDFILLDSQEGDMTFDRVRVSFLPDNTVIGIQRTIAFKQFKQLENGISDKLVSKYGPIMYLNPADVDYHSDNRMWSDTMEGGLRLVGTQYQKSNSIFYAGPTKPYAACYQQMLDYTSSFNPNRLFNDWTLQPDKLTAIQAQNMKQCGKAAWLELSTTSKIFVNKVDLYLVDLREAPEKILGMPQILDKMPDTIRAVPASSLPKPVGKSPDF